jgi:heme-degrading monooxygenase HmoA
MYTRNVSLKLKANSASEFTRTVEKEIIPLLRKQKGFQDEITLVAPERNEAVAISFWDKKEDAEAYNREKYPEILKTLSKMEGLFCRRSSSVLGFGVVETAARQSGLRWEGTRSAFVSPNRSGKRGRTLLNSI